MWHIIEEIKMAKQIVSILPLLFCICKKGFKLEIEITKRNQVKNSKKV